MNLKIRYFAGLREQAGIGAEELEVTAEKTTVAEVQAILADRNAKLAEAFACQKLLRISVDFKMCGPATEITSDCEIAFFPPVTGG